MAIRMTAQRSASSRMPSARNPGPLSIITMHIAYIVTRHVRPTGVTSFTGDILSEACAYSVKRGVQA